MESLSSAMTFFMKRLFPALWFGFLAVFLIGGIVSGAWREAPLFIIQPLLMAAFGLFLFRKLVWDLADEVRDGGTFLLIRKGGLEERVLLSNVININVSQFSNPSRISLRLRTPGKMGDEVVFIPKTTFRLNPFARNALAEKLIRRVDDARQGSTR